MTGVNEVRESLVSVVDLPDNVVKFVMFAKVNGAWSYQGTTTSMVRVANVATQVLFENGPESFRAYRLERSV